MIKNILFGIFISIVFQIPLLMVVYNQHQINEIQIKINESTIQNTKTLSGFRNFSLNLMKLRNIKR